MPALKPTAQGGTEFYRVESGKIAATPFATVGLDDSQTTQPVGFTSDGKTLYWIDSRGRNTAALIAQGTLRDVTIEDAPLDEVIRAFYAATESRLAS